MWEAEPALNKALPCPGFVWGETMPDRDEGPPSQPASSAASHLEARDQKRPVLGVD